jgi:hypothetical protein
MNLLNAKKILILCSGFALAACAATAGVMSKGDGLYTINVYRGDPGKVKLRAFQHAQKFCVEKSNQGIVVVTENQRVDPSGPNMSIIDLDFKCSGPVDSAYGKEVQKDLKKDAGK